MQHPETLNALINPVSYGQEIIINGEVYTVGNCIRDGWTLVSGDTLHVVASAHGQVDFIAEVLKYNERACGTQSRLLNPGICDYFEDDPDLAGEGWSPEIMAKLNSTKKEGK